MSKSWKNIDQRCQVFGQVPNRLRTLFIGVTMALTMSSAFARNPSISDKSKQKRNKYSLSMDMLNPYKKIQTRRPTNFIPDDEVEPIPYRQKIWLQQLLVEDDAGVMVSMRNDIQNWEEEEEYARNWNLESTGLYVVPSKSHQKGVLSRKLLKYADKRLAGEVKDAEEGSTLSKVGKAQKALAPNTEAAVSKNVKLKFKARVLQGKAMMFVENPYVEYETNVNAKGHVNMNMRRDIKSLGVETAVDYSVNDGVYVARVDRPLTDELKARVSSAQSDEEMAFSDESNKTVQLIYNRSF